MTTYAAPATLRQRVAALGAVILMTAVVVVSVLALVGDLRRLPLELGLLAIVLVAAWHAVTRTRSRRLLAVVVALAALVGFVAVSFGRVGLHSVILRIVLLLLAVALVRVGIARDTQTLKQSEIEGLVVAPARHGVLIMNLKSGGGKAERFHLDDWCRERNIEAVVLRPGDDLVDLAERAVDRGADVIGVAGGDGSQALVAGVAARRGVAMVVVPAGTRNHLALDLGLDRDDVVGALDAFGEAVERPMDLAEVNGRVFVNNVSLGLYATIIRSRAYRDAKVDTTLDALPQLLGVGSKPFDLRFTGSGGQQQQGAHVLQISNNPYGQTPGTWSNRPRLDTGRLGLMALEIRDDKAATAFLAAAALGHPERYEGLIVWDAPTFEVDSAAPIDIGLDGETLLMNPPLRFSARPAALRVRLPKHAIGHSPAARDLQRRSVIRAVWDTAIGRARAGGVQGRSVRH